MSREIALIDSTIKYVKPTHHIHPDVITLNVLEFRYKHPIHVAVKSNSIFDLCIEIEVIDIPYFCVELHIYFIANNCTNNYYIDSRST